MSGPQGTDPAEGAPGQNPDEPSAPQTPWQAPSSWQQPTAEDPANAGWGPPTGGYTAQPAYPGYQDPSAAYGAPGYAAPPSSPGFTAPAYPQAPAGYGQPQYGAPGQFGQPGQPQYGAPGQYPPPGQPQYGAPGQFGQPGQPGQPSYGAPGQFGYPQAPGVPGPETETKRTLLAVLLAAPLALITTVLVVVVLVVLVLGFWKPGWFVTTTLDVNKAQEGVQKILSDSANGYGAKNVTDVKCNNGKNPEVEQGATFTCEVSIDGAKRQVTVTFQDNDGTYEVGRPR